MNCELGADQAQMQLKTVGAGRLRDVRSSASRFFASLRIGFGVEVFNLISKSIRELLI